MQFLPFPLEAQSVSALGGAAAKTIDKKVIGEANDFLSAFNKQLAKDGITPVVDPDAEDSLPVGFRAIRRSMGNKLNDDDMTALRNSLKKRGVEDEQLRALEDMMRTGAVPTLGSIMGTISGNKRITPQLSDDERLQLNSALRKMGFTDDEVAGLNTLVDGGHGYEALQSINMRLGKMSKEDRITLDRGEMQGLIRGLELSDEASKKITALFGKADSITADQTGMIALLAQANQDMADKRENQKTLAKELQNAIDDTLKAKKLREATALVADARGSQKSDRAERRMLDDMTAKANGLGPEALADRIRRMAAESSETPEEGDKRHLDEQRTDKESRALAAARQTTPKASDTEVRGQETAKPDPLASMLNKINLAGDMPPAPVNSGPFKSDSALPAQQRQEIYAQVEQGMLRQLSDGTRQITLRLDPVELGQLTVLLSVKDGEVRAMIRAENSETTAALSEQMAQLRASLEEQGLKVAQLDVETQLPQDASSQQWEGTAQYNQEQELREQARFMRLAQMRREAGEELARDMQNKGMREEIAATGMHIIA